MSYLEQLLWVIYPYIAIVIFILGIVFRFNTDQYGWTSKSSEFLEKPFLKWGSWLFHGGIIFVFFGHVGGLIVPLQMHEMLGVTAEQYHLGALIMGGSSGTIAFIGLVLLIYRRLMIKRIRLTSSTGDIVTVVLLFIVIAAGLLTTFTNALDHSGFDYRKNIGPWVRGLITFRPDASLMEQVPVTFKIHILASFTMVASIPFTRIVHMFSVPITYIIRSYVVYRKKNQTVKKNQTIKKGLE